MFVYVTMFPWPTLFVVNQIMPIALWLIVLMTGLPLFSETAYAPSLPEIRKVFQITESVAEYTLTIYLFGFAMGTFFWGTLSDRLGRKPCVILGFIVYTLGCLVCALSEQVLFLMAGRLIQAFGGSAGSVLTQTICRDVFHGKSLSRTYAMIASAGALFPAIGPVFGGIVVQYTGWNRIFWSLMVCGTLVATLVIFLLPETHAPEKRAPVSVTKVLSAFRKDKRVLGFIAVIAICSGMRFTYFAESPFCLIQILGLTPTQYGMTFTGISVSIMLGGVIAARLQRFYQSHEILEMGLWMMLISPVLSFLCLWLAPLSGDAQALVIVTSQLFVMMGFVLVITNALSLSLIEYQWCLGSASSLVGCSYYAGTALITFGMGKIHNGSLLAMPLYFVFLSILMIVIFKKFLLPIDNKASLLSKKR